MKREAEIVAKTKAPITKRILVRDLKRAGLMQGDTVIVHSSLSAIGWTIGGAVTVIEALMEVLTDEGTLVMPTQSTDNGEPSNWQNPAVPEAWWQTIRDETPPYNPITTPTRKMGRIVETFWKYPEVYRSMHPQGSFGAWGKNAQYIVREHDYAEVFGDRSPLGKLYELGAKILLIGIGLESNTSLHYAEFKAELPNMPIENKGAAVLENGERVWSTWVEIAYDDSDFPNIASDYEHSIGYRPVMIGQAESHLLSMRDLIDFAIDWLKQNRDYSKAR